MLSYALQPGTNIHGYSTFSCNEDVIEVDWTRYLGYMSAYTILNFPNLVHLDISNCHGIDPNDFVDVVGFEHLLENLIFDGCVQFTQYHFVKIFAQLKNVKNISLVGCTKLPFTPVYCICASSPKLQSFQFEQDNIDIEKKDWKRLIAIFHYVRLSVTFSSSN